jgi:hypothetical protein
MRREELKWIRTAAVTAIVSLVVLGVCAIVGVAIDLIKIAMLRIELGRC